jgi:hypothetical protein
VLYENLVLLVAFFGNEIIHHAVVCHSVSPKLNRPLLLIAGNAQERKGTREQLTQSCLAFVQ